MRIVSLLAALSIASPLLSQGFAPPPNQITVPSAPTPQLPPVEDYKTPAGNDWFEQTQIDLGVFYDEETAKGKFQFHNPRPQAQQLSNLQASCACSKAVVRIGDRNYEIGADKQLNRVTVRDGNEVREKVTHINVEPGESGEIEVHMSMSGIRGPKEASLNIQCSDPDLALINLRWRATGAQYFVVEPPDVNLNEMAWGDTREFDFRITSPLRPDFNLLSHESLSKGMAVTMKKEMQEGKAVWSVHGTYGPEVEEQDNGGVITFRTDVDNKTVTARVVAYIKGPLTVKPGGFVSLGHVRSDEGRQAEIVFTPNGGHNLQVESLEVVRLTGLSDEARQLVKFEHRKDGNDVKVLIRVEKGMKPTYFNGLLRVHLNHPACRTKEIMFNGFVR